MEKKYVKDLMVPIDGYATVTIGTSLLDAMLSLKKAQDSYTKSKYQHRAILVLDEQQKVVGKISQLRIIKAVETRFDLDTEVENLENFGFGKDYIANRREHYRLQGPILNEASLRAAAEKRVEDFMQKPTAGDFVSEDCSLDVAIHRLVVGSLLSLLVTRNETIVGILRMSDVFSVVSNEMQSACLGS
jgi:CBS-domain-containing membrane protein